MAFSSITFLYFFLPLALGFHYLFKNMVYRNIVLLLFSLIFYAWGEPIMILVLLFTALFDYGNGLLIERFRGSPKAKVVLVFSIIVNIGALVAFKYSGFLHDNLSLLIDLPFQRPKVFLPIGISFYIFRTLSYTTDVYRGTVAAQRNPFSYLLYISLFQLTFMGPIARYEQLQPTLESRHFSWNDFSAGINRFCLGLFKKILIANVAAELTDKYLVNGFSDLTGADAWFGIVMFSIYLYFDFSGYSDMAIGIGRMFGLHILENFRHPYAAISVADFYRRWHISLGTFFRDYVYIPLGGNRKYQDRNIFIVWMLTGLWHGAQWNYVLWGCYFGVIMILEKYARSVLAVTPRFLKHTYTLILIVFSRAIFYFEDFDALWNFITIHLFDFHTFSNLGIAVDVTTHIYWLTIVIILCIPWNEFIRNTGKVWRFFTQSYLYTSPIISLAFLVLSTMMILGSSFNPFFYQKF
jgi:alginate O-acetyltransferase complex protein AlgI